MIVPFEVVPSPQLIVAVKSPAVALGLASVNVATVTVPVELPSVALTGEPVAVSAASATVAVLVAVIVLPPLSVIVTVILSDPSIRIGVAASNGEDPVLLGDGPGRGLAVAPIDRRREVTRQWRSGWRP